MAVRRIAVVSGGNRGIGREICRQLLIKGVSVALGSRDLAQGRNVAAALQETVLPAVAEVECFALDVTRPESVAKFAKAVEQRFGAAEILVNNAGIMPEGRQTSFFDTLPATFRETYEVNVLGPLSMCQTFVPSMKKLGFGRIVNLSSGLGQLEGMGAGLPAYRSSKTALNALTRSLAAELAGSGVLVNSVSPGWVRTDLGGKNAERSVEEGAETAVWLCLLPSGGPTGAFFRDGKQIPW